MVRILFISILFLSLINAQDKNMQNIYETNCVQCHKKIPVTIDKYFYRYLLKYSSETNVKEAMFKYLVNPNENTTIMPEAFIKRFGIKSKSKLSENELNIALDLYWQEYKVFGKLK